MVETLETSHTWSRLGELHAAVGGGDPRLARRPGHRRASSSATSPTPTPTAPRSTSPSSPAPAGARRSSSGGQVKRAACEAIVAAGGTITHHHAVGRDHAPYMEAEVGGPGLEVLRAVKERLDPTGIMNPGKLMPGAEPLALPLRPCFDLASTIGPVISPRRTAVAGVARRRFALLRRATSALVGGVVGAGDVDLVEGAAGDVGEQFGGIGKLRAELARLPTDRAAASGQPSSAASRRARPCRTGPCRSAPGLRRRPAGPDRLLDPAEEATAPASPPSTGFEHRLGQFAVSLALVGFGACCRSLPRWSESESAAAERAGREQDDQDQRRPRRPAPSAQTAPRSAGSFGRPGRRLGGFGGGLRRGGGRCGFGLRRAGSGGFGAAGAAGQAAGSPPAPRGRRRPWTAPPRRSALERGDVGVALLALGEQPQHRPRLASLRAAERLDGGGDLGRTSSTLWPVRAAMSS